MRKLRKDSFAARLTPAQRDELFAALAGGLGLDEAARKVRDWTRAEWPGARPPSGQAISAWFAGEKVARRLHIAREVALQAEANCPDDYDQQARRALGQARFMAVLEGLTPKEIATLERNDIARTKLETDNRVARLMLALDRARLLLSRVKGGESGVDLQTQIDLALDEIEKMKRGEDA